MEHDHLTAIFNRLKRTAIRDQLDGLVDDAARRELTVREALFLFCEREIAGKDERRIEMSVSATFRPLSQGVDGLALLGGDNQRCWAAQAQGVRSASRLLGQLLTSLVSTSVR